ncbi:hypothetical protein [Amycolatopsis sp. CA-230715]|uniref:hypothetical protein n=1 Tax=Amycolatopsis sp. CA-230715 TaxID=2745196 RepID=UPI001C00D6D4|nr:hypothetical protein [Amycolatopsis sp. CA-230715]
MDDWTDAPSAVVNALHEPVYVLHYFQALQSNVKAITPRAAQVLRAAALVRHERWEPTVLGDGTYDYEPDWSNVDLVTAELPAELAADDPRGGSLTARSSPTGSTAAALTMATRRPCPSDPRSRRRRGSRAGSR